MAGPPGFMCMLKCIPYISKASNITSVVHSRYQRQGPLRCQPATVVDTAGMAAVTQYVQNQPMQCHSMVYTYSQVADVSHACHFPVSWPSRPVCTHDPSPLVSELSAVYASLYLKENLSQSAILLIGTSASACHKIWKHPVWSSIEPMG